MKVVRVLVLLIVHLTLQRKTDSAGTLNDVNDLYNALLNSGYNKNVSPRPDTDTPVTVNLSVSILSIKEFNEVDGKFSFAGYLTVNWLDPRMQWTGWSYNHTYIMRFPSKDVWVPPITLVNPYDDIDIIGKDFFTVLYDSNGNAYYTPGDIISSSCNVDVRDFPFDTQTCIIVFTNWGYSYTEISLQSISTQLDTNSYKKHGSWNLVSSKVESVIKNQASTVEVSISLKRRPAYVIATIIMPMMCVLVLDILVFMLPVDCGERVSFSITVLLALAVFLTLVGDTLPKTSEPMSSLSYFLLTALGLSSISCFMTTVSIKIYNMADDKSVPKCIQRLKQLLTFEKCKKRNEISVDANENISDKGGIECDKNQDGGVEKKQIITWQQVSNFVDKVMIIFNSVSLIIIIISFCGLTLTT